MTWRTSLVFGVPFIVVLLGLYLWWHPKLEPDRYSDLGATLVGGGVVAFAVLYLERRYAAEADKRNLQLMLGIEDIFVGIDLSGRDLSGFYLAGKDFSGAKLEGSNLSGANLSGTNLSWANLAGSDLRGAKLSKTPLKPSEYLKPSEDLKPGAIAPGGRPLEDAKTQGIIIGRVKYDSATKWPENFDPATGGAVFVKDHPWWRRWFGV